MYSQQKVFTAAQEVAELGPTSKFLDLGVGIGK
jgi:hypothetical protein